MNIIKKIITGIITIWYGCLNKLTLRYRRVQVGKGLKIHGHLHIAGHGRIVIGDQVTINSSFSSNPIGGDGRTVFSIVPGAALVIGNRVGLSNCAIVCHKGVTIEEGAVIGGGVKLYDTDFHSLNGAQRGHADRETAVKRPIRIKKNAFIGAHSILLKGVTIGENSVIGAGSVVTRDVPDNEIWAGNPARRIRKLTAELKE